MNYKKNVKLERVVAVILDGLLVGMVSSIVSFVVMMIFGDGEVFFDFVVDDFNIENLTGMTTPIFALFVLASFIGALFYYVYIPYRFNGQTIGKMAMKIKAIDDLGNNPNLKQHILRAIRVYSYFLSVPFLITLFFNDAIYLFIDSTTSTAATVLMIISFFMILGRDDARGLHDLIAGTYVVDKNYDPDIALREAATQAKEWADIESDEEDDTMVDPDDPWEK